MAAATTPPFANKDNMDIAYTGPFCNFLIDEGFVTNILNSSFAAWSAAFDTEQRITAQLMFVMMLVIYYIGEIQQKFRTNFADTSKATAGFLHIMVRQIEGQSPVATHNYQELLRLPWRTLSAACLLVVALIMPISAIPAHSNDITDQPAASAHGASMEIMVPNEMAPPNPQPNLVPYPRFTDTEKTNQRQAAEKLLNDLQTAIKNGMHNFKVPPGDYRFDTKLNRNLDFDELKDFVFDGTGATLWFDQQYGIKLQNCTNVTLRGFVFDMDPVPWMQGRIERMDGQAKAIDVVLEPGYSPPTNQLKLQRQVMFFDHANGRELSVDMDGGTSLIQPLGQNRLRLSKFGQEYGFRQEARPRTPRAGDRIVILDVTRGNASQIKQTNCQRTTVEDVTIYASTGLAFLESGGAGGNVYRKCKIGRRPGTNRLLASAADGLHSALMKKGPLIEECDFSATSDDLINIHGFFSVVVEQINGRELLVAGPMGRTVQPNSYLRFYRSPDGEYVTEGQVVKLQPITSAASKQKANQIHERLKNMCDSGVRGFDDLDLVQVELDRTVNCHPTDLITTYENCGAGAIVRGNYLHDAHARGVIARTRDILIENNRIERTFDRAISFTPEFFWLEGPFIRQAKVLGNVIANNDWNVFETLPGQQQCQGSISIFNNFGKSLFPQTLVHGWQNQGIEISHNQISNSPLPGIFVANASNIKIIDNEINKPFALGKDDIHFDWSGLLTPGWKASNQELDILRAPYFGIFIQETNGAEIRDNRITNKAAFIRGDIGCGPGAPPPLSKANQPRMLPLPKAAPSQPRPAAPAQPAPPKKKQGTVKRIEHKLFNELKNLRNELP